MASERLELDVRNEHGLHARPAALFVQTAARFNSSITLRNLSRDDRRAINAKSIMDVLTAGVDQGSRIELEIEGDDAQQAAQVLRDLIERDLAGH